MKWRSLLIPVAFILISTASLWCIGCLPRLPQANLSTSISTPTPTTKTPQPTLTGRENEVCVYQVELVEAVVNVMDYSTTFTTKPFNVVMIQCPRRIVDIVFRDDLAVIYIDNEVASKIKNTTWVIWYKQGYEWTQQDMEIPPSLVVHNVYEIVLKKLEGYSTTVVVKITLDDSSVEVEEIGVGGYVPYTARF